MKTALALLTVALAVTAVVLLALPAIKKQEAQALDSTAEYVCVGREVAGYMNAVINLSGPRRNVKLASPAFNLTSQFTPIIFNAMISANANFASLDGFTGNIYTIPVSGETRLAYDWYSNVPHPDGRTWKSIFDGYGKPVIFSEFGDFDTFDRPLGNRPDLIDRMKNEHNRTAGDGAIQGIIYFNAFGTNRDFKGHQLTDSELQTVTSGNPGKGGVNSAVYVGAAGDFAARVRSVANLGWTLEIIQSPGNLDAAVAAANSATAHGMVAVLRTCVGDTCGLSNPADMAAFIKALDSRVNGEVWVIAGPNEPDTERWASPSCGASEETFCDESKNFHSLRPFPACPIDKRVTQTAYMCGSKLAVVDQVNANINEAGLGDCQENEDGSTTCRFRKSRSTQVTIDLAEADLPIIGNTELTKNSQDTTPDRQLTPAEKVNEYVSWYLNGVINRAEDDFLNPNDAKRTQEAQDAGRPTDEELVVDFSGPLNKLLPLNVQWSVREDVVRRAGNQQHDQIAACTYGLTVRFPPLPFPWGKEITIVGIPGPCYEGGIAQYLDTQRTLSEWRELQPITNQSRLPPYSSDYDDFQDYYLAYRRWRGDVCWDIPVPIFVPVVGGRRVIICGDDPGDVFAPNFWSNLYPYVPYSSTEDRIGQYRASAPSRTQSDGVNVTNIRFESPAGDLPKNLYFAHMEETTRLAQLLQYTFAPRVYSNTLLNDIKPPEFGEQCQIIDARTNPGDKLLPSTVPLSERQVRANLSYDLEFECTFDEEQTNCSKSPTIAIDVATAMPKADELWARLVGGSASVFRRIYPKVGVDSVLREIRDIPGSTTVSYNITNSDGQRIQGNPNELYLPHVGGLQEYFLRGIQKALRPKDLDTNIISGSGQTGSCSLGNAPWCSVENLTPWFNNDTNKATNASQICQKESGSNPRALNDACTYSTDRRDNDNDGLIDFADPDYDKATLDYSVGLFQINLLAHCPGAFSYTQSPPTCRVIDEVKKNACLQRLFDPEENIKEAFRISSGGTNWRPWSAARACGI